MNTKDKCRLLTNIKSSPNVLSQGTKENNWPILFLEAEKKKSTIDPVAPLIACANGRAACREWKHKRVRNETVQPGVNETRVSPTATERRVKPTLTGGR